MGRKRKVNGETLTMMFGQTFCSPTTLRWSPKSQVLQLTNVLSMYKLKFCATTNEIDCLPWYLQQFLLSNVPPVGQWHPEGIKVKEE